MKRVREEFERREEEVDAFFKFLRQTLRPDVRLSFERNKTWRHRPINIDLSRILKSSAYLVLYNLVESTVRLAIGRLNTVMSEDGLTYEDALLGIREVWVEANLKALAQGANHGRYLKIVKRLVEDVQERNVAGIPESFIPVDGNFDARKMRDLAVAYGFRRNGVVSGRISYQLKTVKDRRNDLAHGIKSFATLSADDSLQDLEDTKKAVMINLREFIRHVGNHIEQKKYRVVGAAGGSKGENVGA